MHERQSVGDASFATLTYSCDSVSDVSKDDCVGFMKRLRKRLEPNQIRFFLGAEYGEKGNRPHYHALIFGHDFRKDQGARSVGKDIWTSPLLEKAWGHGHVSSGTVTPASIRYVANYILGRSKEKTPDAFLDPETGDEIAYTPVFALMSRNPGLGSEWIREHAHETYRDNNVVVDGFVRVPPRFYDYRVCKGKPGLKEVLQKSRRDARLESMKSDPTGWLSNHHPARNRAKVQADKTKRAMKRKGSL